MIYPYTTKYYEANDHTFWMAESSCLKGCVGQGNTLEEAIKQLEENEKEWLETAKMLNIPIPELVPAQMPSHSGKFTVRLSPSTHSEAVALAKSQGVSLTQYVNDAIVSLNAKLSTLQTVDKYFTPIFQKIDKITSSFYTISHIQSTENSYTRERNTNFKEGYRNCLTSYRLN